MRLDDIPLSLGLALLALSVTSLGCDDDTAAARIPDAGASAGDGGAAGQGGEGGEGDAGPEAGAGGEADSGSEGCGALFACGEGRCLPHAKVCNGQQDCADGSDEADCGEAGSGGGGQAGGEAGSGGGGQAGGEAGSGGGGQAGGEAGSGGGGEAGSGGGGEAGSGGGEAGSSGGEAGSGGGEAGSGGGEAGSGGGEAGSGGGEAGSGGSGPDPECGNPDFPQHCPPLGDFQGGCWPETSDCSTILACTDGVFHACQPEWLPYCDEAGEFHCRRDPSLTTDIVIVDLRSNDLRETVSRAGEDWLPSFEVQVQNLGGAAAPFTRARVLAVPVAELFLDEEDCQIERYHNAYTLGEVYAEGPAGEAELTIPVVAPVIDSVNNRALPVGRYVWFSKIEVRAAQNAEGAQEPESDFCNNYARLPGEWEVTAE